MGSGLATRAGLNAPRRLKACPTTRLPHHAEAVTECVRSTKTKNGFSILRWFIRGINELRAGNEKAFLFWAFATLP